METLKIPAFIYTHETNDIRSTTISFDEKGLLHGPADLFESHAYNEVMIRDIIVMYDGVDGIHSGKIVLFKADNSLDIHNFIDEANSVLGEIKYGR